MAQPEAIPVNVVSASPTQGKGTSAVVAFTRPADTTAYGAVDVVGPFTASGGGILVFPKMGDPNSEIILTTAALQRNVSALVSTEATYRLYFYNAPPTSALGDNAAWDLTTTDRNADPTVSTFLGYADLGTPVDLGSTLLVQTNFLNLQLKLGPTGNLYAYLVTITGYTPASADPYQVTLHARSI